MTLPYIYSDGRWHFFLPYTEVNIKIKCPVYIYIVINTEVNAFCFMYHKPFIRR